MCRLEAALGRGWRDNPPSMNGLGYPFEVMIAEAFVFEPSGCELVCPRAHYYCVWCGQCLQTSGKIRSVSDHRVFLGGALANEVTDYNRPGGDAQPHS